MAAGIGSLFTSYPNGFTNGIIIRGVPLAQTHPGKVFWVDNSSPGNGDIMRNGSDANKGTFQSPYATLNYAVTQARASKGDIIFVKPGHVETITAAAGITIGVAGVAIIGLGFGSNRPTFNFTTANTANIALTAKDVIVSNILFSAGFLNVASAFKIANAQVATDFVIDNCEFRDQSAVLNFVSAVLIGTTANIADGFTFSNNKVIGSASTPAAATTVVVSSSIIDRLTMTGNYAAHAVLLANTSVLLAMGANDLTHAFIDGNRTYRPNTSNNTGEILSSSSTASTGLVSNNISGTLSANGLTAPTGTKLSFSRNFTMITGAADKSALENPAAV